MISSLKLETAAWAVIPSPVTIALSSFKMAKPSYVAIGFSSHIGMWRWGVNARGSSPMLPPVCASVVLNLHQERSKSLDFDWGFQGDSTRAVPAALWRDLVCQNEAITFHILVASRTFFGLLNRLQWKCMHADAEMELFLPVINLMSLIQSKLESSWFRMKVLGFCLSTCLIQLSSRC